MEYIINNLAIELIEITRYHSVLFLKKIRYTISRIPSVLTIKSAINHINCLLRAECQRAIPFQIIDQAINKKSIGLFEVKICIILFIFITPIIVSYLFINISYIQLIIHL